MMVSAKRGLWLDGIPVNLEQSDPYNLTGYSKDFEFSGMNGLGGLGAVDFGSFSLGTGSGLLVAALGVGALLFLLTKDKAREKRMKLAEARREYAEKVDKIQAEYGFRGRKKFGF